MLISARYEMAPDSDAPRMTRNFMRRGGFALLETLSVTVGVCCIQIIKR